MGFGTRDVAMEDMICARALSCRVNGAVLPLIAVGAENASHACDLHRWRTPCDATTQRTLDHVVLRILQDRRRSGLLAKSTDDSDRLFLTWNGLLSIPPGWQQLDILDPIPLFLDPMIGRPRQ